MLATVLPIENVVSALLSFLTRSYFTPCISEERDRTRAYGEDPLPDGHPGKGLLRTPGNYSTEKHFYLQSVSYINANIFCKPCNR